MNVLGISDHFVSGAAIVRDGTVVTAVNEERLARRKMVMGFPWKSIEAVLELAGIGPGEIDRVAVASEWGHFLPEYVGIENGIYAIDEGFVKNLFLSVGSHLSFLRSRVPLLERMYYDLRKPAYARRRQEIVAALQRTYDIQTPVEFVSHHLAHAVAAYLASDYDDALVVTLDGAGDGDSSHVYECSGGRWDLLHTVPAFDSLGDYYSYVTQMCGFKAGKHEGKITGLAAYGSPDYSEVLNRFIQYKDGTIVNVGNTFRHVAMAKLAKALPSDFDHATLAATVQQTAEEIAVRYVTHWLERTGKRNVALSGGVFANVKINQRIHEIDGVDSVFVYPAMADEGLSAGAALVSWAGQGGRDGERPQRCFDNVYLGHSFDEESIARALDDAGLDYERFQEIEPEIARLIHDGHVVARFVGAMEYGPRALGNRSILYSPHDPAVNDWLNKRLGRTEFMPFAPSTLAEDAGLYYTGLEGCRDTARFMTITFDCTDRMKDTCAGVVHIDGTARPQLVVERDNPSYHRILCEFKRLTDNSTIVNTSFNIHEEPIVCTPQDAIRAFQQGHLDVLAIGPFVVNNPEADPRP